MSDDFKQKLKAYIEGTLSDEERLEVENELEKMETYQSYMDELMPEKTFSSGDFNEQRKVVTKGKWKARIQNAFTVLSLFMLIAIVSGFISSIFFAWGETDRMETYRDVVKSTIAVTEPNVKLESTGASANIFFTMDLDGQLRKRNGTKDENIGDFHTRFLFGWPSTPKFENRPTNELFVYPNDQNNFDFSADWKRLKKLPKGTVAEAYVSFNSLYSTEKVLDKFMGRNMKPVWFAVDTGLTKDSSNVHTHGSAVTEPIGMPFQPIMHTDVKDMKWKPYNSSEFRNKNFLKTLQLIQDYDHISKVVARPPLKLQERIDYVKNHGVKIYGAVITGPSKELLTLKDEQWVNGAKIGDVRLWNWR